MKTTENTQQATGNHTTGRKPGLIMSIALWTVQILLALLFLGVGIMKLTSPFEALAATMFVPLPEWFIRFIGVAEVAGALGLILPTLFRILPVLTPLAAIGLILIMVGAVVTTLIGGGTIVLALFPLVVGLLCLFVAYGRRPRKQVA